MRSHGKTMRAICSSLLLLLLPSCWLFLSRSPSSSSWFFFFVFLTFPHICYIVDRRKLTTNPTDRPLQSTLDGKQQQSGTHNFPQTILILSLLFFFSFIFKLKMPSTFFLFLGEFYYIVHQNLKQIF
jgi:hypothetical protein